MIREISALQSPPAYLPLTMYVPVYRQTHWLHLQEEKKVPWSTKRCFFYFKKYVNLKVFIVFICINKTTSNTLLHDVLFNKKKNMKKIRNVLRRNTEKNSTKVSYYCVLFLIPFNFLNHNRIYFFFNYFFSQWTSTKIIKNVFISVTCLLLYSIPYRTI